MSEIPIYPHECKHGNDEGMCLPCCRQERDEALARVEELEKAIERIETGVSAALSQVDEYEDTTYVHAIRDIQGLFSRPITGPSVSTEKSTTN